MYYILIELHLSIQKNILFFLKKANILKNIL